MRIRLVCVGRPRDPAMIALHDRYAERVRRLGVPYVASWVPDAGGGGRYTDAHVTEREALALLDAIPPAAHAVALDRSGSGFSSPEIAARLTAWSQPEVAFVVGGPLGLHASLLDRAAARWSLSPLTLPHEMVRVVAAEQVYRALTLLRRIPYHR